MASVGTKEDKDPTRQCTAPSKAWKFEEKNRYRLAEYSAESWDIGFALQPANLPDLNTLDLGFFRAIQSLQYQKLAKNLDEMIEIVHKVYADLPLDVCKNLWTTAQLVMNQVLLCNGGNDYKLSHIEKLKIAAANSRDIPMRLPCHALIAGNHLDADAITAAMIVSSEQGAPARLFFIVHFFPCIFLIVVSPLPLLVTHRRPSRLFLIATPSRRCRHRHA